MSDLSNLAHLIRRHPEIAKLPEFNDWLQHYSASRWHETAPDDSGTMNVVVQSNDGLAIFAAQVRREIVDAEAEDGIRHDILSHYTFEPKDLTISAAQAAATALRTTNAATRDIIAVRPIVDFKKSPPVLGWEVEVAKGNEAQAFSIFSVGDVIHPKSRDLTTFRSERRHRRELIPPTSDWLASDDCHHLNQWRATAQQMAAGATTTADKARKIWAGVRAKMTYDANIQHISEFTHSDNLAISNYGWKGICDEWAVVQITLLRALGIPATLKFLIWKNGSQGVGHACLEWQDGSTWRHMDALWNAFDNKSVYRANGATSLTVMDATYPQDSRSTVPAWGVPDPTGDQKFYPYGDFIIAPSYPGNSRPGYSN